MFIWFFSGYEYDFGHPVSLPSFDRYDLCWSHGQVVVSVLRFVGPLDENLAKKCAKTMS